jgi:hypothetical protein
MSRPSNEERLASSRRARQVISGTDVRPPASYSGVYTHKPAGVLSSSQVTYLAALVVLLLIAAVLYLVFGMGVASIFFFLLALTLIAGWLVF